jgi:hypothetical protein
MGEELVVQHALVISSLMGEQVRSQDRTMLTLMNGGVNSTTSFFTEYANMK